MKQRQHNAGASIIIEGDALVIDGAITMANAPQLRQLAAPLLERTPVVDFARAQCVDSSALLLILAWQRAVNARGQTLQLRSIPQQLFALAEVYGIKDLLPL